MFYNLSQIIAGEFAKGTFYSFWGKKNQVIFSPLWFLMQNRMLVLIGTVRVRAAVTE